MHIQNVMKKQVVHAKLPSIASNSSSMGKPLRKLKISGIGPGQIRQLSANRGDWTVQNWGTLMQDDGRTDGDKKIMSMRPN